MESIYRLVLKNGMVLTVRDPWPGPDGKPFSINGNPIPAHVWLIAYVPESVTSYPPMEDGTQSSDSDPAHFEVLMRSNDKNGMKNDGGLYETQIYRIAYDNVLFVGSSSEWNEAVQHFAEILGYEDEVPKANGGPIATVSAP